MLQREVVAGRSPPRNNRCWNPSAIENLDKENGSWEVAHEVPGMVSRILLPLPLELLDGGVCTVQDVSSSAGLQVKVEMC